MRILSRNSPLEDYAGIGNNALGQSIILGGTAALDAYQDGENLAALVRGDWSGRAYIIPDALKYRLCEQR
jgi:hypothetical protein